MRREMITYRQALAILVMFMFGSSVVLGVNSEAGQDSWASLLIGIALSLPVLLMYARLMKLFPETGFYEILKLLFGPIFGKILVALFTWYVLHLGSLVIRNFTEFVQLVAMPETPQLPIMILLMLVTAYLAAGGMKILGKWAVFTFPIVLSVVVITILFSFGVIDFANFLPILTTKPLVLLRSGASVLSFPLAETVVFLSVSGMFSKTDSPYKLYIRAVLAGGLILLSIIVRNMAVLGPAMVQSAYFPSYSTARIIQIAEFLSRIEGSISMNFLLAGITKITLCLIAAAKGIAFLFDIEDYRRMLMPTGLLMLALCAIIYKSTMEMFAFLKYYTIYAAPFQILIPLLAWVFGEIQAKRRKAVPQAS